MMTEKKRTVGPLDKRKATTRCKACAKRRIKCEGGNPCLHCDRTGKQCIPQTAGDTSVKFVITPSVTTPPNQVPEQADTMYLNYFASFLQRCQITRSFVGVAGELVPLIESSPSLRHVAVAIGALELSRTGSVRSGMGQQTPQWIAFISYGSCIQALQQQICSPNAVQEEDIIWGTFLLGLFELLTGSSADGWARHMISGTSLLFRLAGLTKQRSSLREKLFDAFRVFEISRAIMYGETTFLSEEAWSSSQQVVTTRRTLGPDLFEVVLELMLQTSSFAKEFFDQVEAVPEHLRPNDASLDSLAVRSMEIQERISRWKDQANAYTGDANHHNQLAAAWWHAVQIYHCWNFTHYSAWTWRPIPSIPQHQAMAHVTAILKHSADILSDSRIPSVLLLFPMRMAGVGAETNQDRDKILHTLGVVGQKGFVVSERIRADLEELWNYQANDLIPRM